MDIILNYGIEIECVFDIINELNVYIRFIEFFFKEDNIEKKIEILDKNDETFNEELNELIELIKQFEEKNIIIDKINEIKENYIYIKLNEIYMDDKNYYIFFKEEYNKILKYSQSLSFKKKSNTIDEEEYHNIKIFISNFTIFIKDFIILISNYINENDIIDPEINDTIYYILELFVIDDFFKDFENRIKFSESDNLIIYNENNRDLSSFYNKSLQSDNKLYLYLTKDCSVVCNDKKVYKNIISSKLSEYKFLFNKSEFITQVFNTPDEINKKLNIFFSNTKIQNTILNCEKTSNHVHISFNNIKIIKPDINIIISLVCICYYFQDDIYKLFLNTRHNNNFCKKLNFNGNKSDYDFFTFKYDLYDEYIKKIFNLFYIISYDDDDDDIYMIKNNRFFWLNIINLFGLDDDDIDGYRPPTVEFRIKHGSTDTEELANVCKLYKNIINYAMEISHIITKNDNNIIDIYEKIIEHIEIESPINIYNNKILGDVKKYFTDSKSKYVIGLNELNKILIDDDIKISLKGGKLEKPLISSSLYPKYLKKQKKILKKKYNTGNKFLDKKLEILDNKKIYKINSFGKQFIGYGLNNDMSNDLLLYLETNNNFSNYTNLEKFEKFIKDYGLYIK